MGDEEHDHNALGCSCRGTPMLLIGFICITLDIVEAIASFHAILQVSWVNAVVAGIMFKWTSLSIVLWMSEGLLKSAAFGQCGILFNPLQTWVYGHRIANDFVISGFVLC